MSAIVTGTVYPGVEVGEGAEIHKGAVVKSGYIPPKGYIHIDDVVERAYGYTKPDSLYSITVTQKYFCVGCVCCTLDELHNFTEEDIRVLGSEGAVKWYRKHQEWVDTIISKHLFLRGL